MRLAAPVVAIGFIVAATWKWLGPRVKAYRQRRRGAVAAARPEAGWLTKFGLQWRRKFVDRPYIYALGLGLLMSLLPCMLTAWVLGLAFVSGSVLHGTIIMILLVVLTTPALLPFAVMPAGLPSWRWLNHPGLAIGLWYLSGIWMGLIALASHGVIDHVSIIINDWRVVLW